jgi:hypothetical protein
MLATIQRLVALTALTIFVLLQVFGTAWHQAAHAAEHAGVMSGLELAVEDHGDVEHMHLTNGVPSGHDIFEHVLHHALHSASHMFEHMQLPGAQMATPVLEAARPARWRSSTLPEGGMVDPTVPPPNA